MSMQDVLVVTTEHGTTYEFFEDFCLRTKNTRGSYGHIMKIWTMKSGVGVYEPGEANSSWKDTRSPEVGKNLYVAGREGWYNSTKVVSVARVRKEFPVS